eukprot:gnl/MRDRNA2_/MRDRNA2_102523_c0_seq1.p1 gnl/MRDRNA2_/MRDRNA2_102523_c0~~gnl/MRDRNA2_/MRDRNA2_102523_c0_seq1.p1  ORF type:complete len:497 (+),score=99.26 gnl/MRDRNA2_/MRDRNA2_102523_c0_seq1:90-1580(+)
MHAPNVRSFFLVAVFGMRGQALAETVRVMTWNLACRPGDLQKCDNCAARFEEIANAISSGTDTTYLNMPDFEKMEVIIAQELFVEDGDVLLAVLDKAMETRGFVRVGVPGPNKDDPQCEDPFVPDFAQDFGSKMAEVPNGGLVMWTKLKVIDIHARKWCYNVFPTYHGYTIAYLQKSGVNILVFNSHFAPELPEFGEKFQKFAQQIRSYQVSELKNEALWFSKAFDGQELAYAIIFGGDSNEDAFGYANKNQPNFQCGMLSSTPRVAAFFEAIGLPSMTDQCERGVIGSGFTWDWSENDIVKRSREAYELLDFVTLLAKSGSPVTSQSPMFVHHIKKAIPFAVQFCQDMVSGGEPMIDGTIQSLSDHDSVVATITIPEGSSTSLSESDLRSLFQDRARNFNAQEAACGQDEMTCLMDSHCCENAEFSFDGKEKGCYMQDFDPVCASPDDPDNDVASEIGIGIIVAIVIATCIACGGLCFCLWRKRKSNEVKNTSED